MKELKSIKFKSIQPDQSYLFFREENTGLGGGDLFFYKATGKEILNRICEIYDYEDWKKVEAEYSKKPNLSINKFLQYVEEANGDCVDYIQIFKLLV